MTEQLPAGVTIVDRRPSVIRPYVYSCDWGQFDVPDDIREKALNAPLKVVRTYRNYEDGDELIIEIGPDCPELDAWQDATYKAAQAVFLQREAERQAKEEAMKHAASLIGRLKRDADSLMSVDKWKIVDVATIANDLNEAAKRITDLEAVIIASFYRDGDAVMTVLLEDTDVSEEWPILREIVK